MRTEPAGSRIISAETHAPGGIHTFPASRFPGRHRAWTIQRRIAANRRNTKKSTGPRSPEGKAVSRFNALKHGIDAESQCLLSEDPDALEVLAAE